MKGMKENGTQKNISTSMNDFCSLICEDNLQIRIPVFFLSKYAADVRWGEDEQWDYERPDC